MSLGIPPLLNNIAQLGNKVSLLTADAQRIIGLFSNAAPQWGIYRKGELVIKPDSMISLDNKYEWAVADYPMEQGAFETYNKVRRPNEVRVVLSKGGNDAKRAQFLTTLQNMGRGTTRFDVYMPEGALANMTVTHVGYARTQLKGVGLLSVEVRFLEVMETAATAFTNTATASGNSPQQGGTVQTQAPTPAQRAAVGGGGAAGGGI